MKTLATHNGPFHTDDVMSYIILKGIYPNHTLFRTRNQEQINTCDIVFDVGEVFDPAENKFDHHFQNSPTRKNGIRYSSAGLIWKYYGSLYLTKKLKEIDRSTIDQVWNELDLRIFESIDGGDNGQIENTPKGCITLQHMVNSFLPMWNSNQSIDDAFYITANWLENWFEREISRGIGRIKSEQLVLFDFKNRKYENILIMESFRPWQNTIFKYGLNQHLDYIIFYDDINDDWKIQCVPVRKGSYTSKIPLPKKWGEVNKEKLSKIVGIDMVFCHSNRFIAGFKNKSDIDKLVEYIYND